MKQQTLGRGLKSLIPKRKKPSGISSLLNPSPKRKISDNKKESIFNIEIDKIRPNPHQPRQSVPKESLEDLAGSIKEHGILQPLLVSQIETTTERGRKVEYELIAGERRWRAAKMIGLPHVPAIIRGSSANKKLELALVENIQREDLNNIELAFAYKELQDRFNLAHDQIAKKVGKSRSTVSNTLRMLTLPAEIQKALAGGQISEGHGRAILMAIPGYRLTLCRDIIKNGLNVRQAEEKAREFAKPKDRFTPGPKNPIFKKIEKELAEIIGSRISITQRRGKGYLRIGFANQEELDKLASYLVSFK